MDQTRLPQPVGTTSVGHCVLSGCLCFPHLIPRHFAPVVEGVLVVHEFCLGVILDPAVMDRGRFFGTDGSAIWVAAGHDVSVDVELAAVDVEQRFPCGE